MEGNSSIIIQYASREGAILDYEVHYELRPILERYFPENAVNEVQAILNKYKLELYFVPYFEKGYAKFRGFCMYNRITIKLGISRESFLEIFLHEFAHYIVNRTFNYYTGHCDAFHLTFNELIRHFINKKILTHKDYYAYFYFRGSYMIRDYWEEDVPNWKPDEYHKRIRKILPQGISLLKIKVGNRFCYKNEEYERIKGKRGVVFAKSTYDSTINELDPYTEVQPILKFDW